MAAMCFGMFTCTARAEAAEPNGKAHTESSETIVVTARKIREHLIDVPASVSVVSAAGLDSARLRTFADVTGVLPNVAFSGGIGGQLQGQVAIRGIATLVRNIGVESGIGVYVDGVYIGRPENFNQELLDVAQVELLRGPQGTVFGKNTIAGVFNITSGSPTEKLSGNARLEGGNYGLLRAQTTISGPLAGDDLTGRISLGYARRDGFEKHISGGQDANNLGLFSWRGALAYQASDRVVVTLRTDGLRDRSVPGFFSSTDLGLPGAPASLPPHEIDNNRPNLLRRDVSGFSLTAEAKLGSLNMTSISAYRESRYAASVDDDQRQIDLLAVDNFADRSDMWSQELRLSGKVTETLSFLTGFYFLDQVTRTDRTLGLGAFFALPFEADLTTKGMVKTRSYAAFGNVDWRVIPSLTLSVGLRFTHERKTAQFVQNDETGVFTTKGLPNIRFAGKSEGDDVSPTISVSYSAAPNIRVYGRVARGVKSAAFNVDIASSANGLMAGAERATTYEGGIKADLLDAGVNLSLSGFHTAYDNLQVSQLTGGSTTLSNAGKASVDGFEATLTVRPSDGLHLESSVGYADAKYNRFDNCAVPLSEGGGATNCAGKRLTGAPLFTSHGAVEYLYPVSFGNVVARVEANHQSSVYFEPTNSDRFRGGARTLLNSRLTAKWPSWSVSAWIENLTDEVYVAYHDDRTAVGVLRTTAYGPPRTYGLTITRQF